MVNLMCCCRKLYELMQHNWTLSNRSPIIIEIYNELFRKGYKLICHWTRWVKGRILPHHPVPRHQKMMLQQATTYSVRNHHKEFKERLKKISKFIAPNRPIGITMSYPLTLSYEVSGGDYAIWLICKYLGHHKLVSLKIPCIPDPDNKLGRAEFFSDLQKLSIGNCKINPITIHEYMQDQHFEQMFEPHEQLKKLESLSIDWTMAGLSGARWLTPERFPKLRELATTTHMPLSKLEEVATNMHKLKIAHPFYADEIDDYSGNEYFEEILNTQILKKNLRHLDISGLDDINDCSLFGRLAQEVPNLKILCIDISELHLDSFANVQFTSLSALKFSADHGYTWDIILVTFMENVEPENFPSLHTLDVSCVRVGNNDPHVLQQDPHENGELRIKRKLPRLRKLVLPEETIIFVPAETTTSD